MGCKEERMKGSIGKDYMLFIVAKRRRRKMRRAEIIVEYESGNDGGYRRGITPTISRL